MPSQKVDNPYLPKGFRICPRNRMPAASGDFLPAEGELCTPKGRKFIYLCR